MAVYQSVILSPDAIKMRWKEPYITAGLNTKTLALLPKGVFTGFTVAPNAGYTVDVQVDPVLGIAGANVLETTGGKYCVTIIQTSTIPIDLTAQAGLTVFIALDAQYAVGASTAAQVRVVDAAEAGFLPSGAAPINPDLVILARVDVPASPVPGGPITAAMINMGYRTSSGDSLPPDAKPRVNLIGNPGFEQDANTVFPLGWQFFGSGVVVTASTDNAHTGTKSMKMVAAAPANAFVRTFLPCVGGETYRVGMWIRAGATAISGAGVRLEVAFVNRADAIVGSTVLVDTAFTGAGTTYVQRKGLVTAPVDADMAVVVVLFDAATAGIAYVDDIEFSTARQDTMMQSRVFGGPTANADAMHNHSGGGSYAGGGAWADGTTNGPNTIEGQLDKIITDIGQAGGAAKVGFLPVTPVDLGGITRVDTALNTLDDQKAGIAIFNTFTRQQAFNPGAFGGNAIDATGGVGGYHAVSGLGTGTTGVGLIGRGDGAGFPGTNGEGVIGVGKTTGTGASGGFFLGNLEAPGVYGLANGNTNLAGNFNGVSPQAGPGTGVVGIGSAGSGGGDGGQFFARSGVGSTSSRSGLLACGSYSQTTGIPSGAGAYFFGGNGTVGNAGGGNAVLGQGGLGIGSGQAGAGGVFAAGAGVGALGNIGVFASGTGSWAAFHAGATTSGVALDAASQRVANVGTPIADNDATTKFMLDERHAPNILHNSRFSVWNRAGWGYFADSDTTYAPSPGTYLIDRWKLVSANGSPGLGQVEMYQTLALFPTQLGLSWWKSGAGVGVVRLFQEIERSDVIRLRGHDLSLSLKLTRTAAALTNFRYKIVTGTGPVSQTYQTPYTGEVTILNSGSFVPSLSATVYSATTTALVPANALTMCVIMEFDPIASVNNRFDVDWIRLVPGAAPAVTPAFAGGTEAGEVALCEWYYQKSGTYGNSFPNQSTTGSRNRVFPSSGGTSSAWFIQDLHRPMRHWSPQHKVYRTDAFFPTGAAGGEVTRVNYPGGGGITTTTAVVVTSGAGAFEVQLTSLDLTASRYAYYHWSSDSDY